MFVKLWNWFTEPVSILCFAAGALVAYFNPTAPLWVFVTLGAGISALVVILRK